ncbi:MAG: hypothetical protein OEV07_13760 [Gammaproteobacteria bacterium]|nr:hypothetical protein [Gammaproteobacteria bacterium]
MSLLNLQASYFAIEDPLRLLERWLHRFNHCQTVRINQREVEISWTDRADRELQRRKQALVVELQLYFSCVVKKRVLFHQRAVEFDSIRVNDKFEIAFQPIASAACDPREFAANYPQGKNLSAGNAARMVPRAVEIDYRRNNWEGQFYY